MDKNVIEHNVRDIFIVTGIFLFVLLLCIIISAYIQYRKTKKTKHVRDITNDAKLLENEYVVYEVPR